MTTPSPRNSIRTARGLYSDLLASVADLGDGELCYSTDHDKFYTPDGSGGLLEVGKGTAITSIGQLGDVDLTGLQSGEVLKWDGTSWSPAADSSAVSSVAGKTGAVTLVKADITDFSDADYATAAQGGLADSAVQPGDDISDLNNDAGFITSAQAPVQPGDIPVVGAGVITLESYGEGAAADSTFQMNQILNQTVTLPQIRYSDLSGTPTIPLSLDGLSDVTIDAGLLSADQGLVYNGAGWVVGTPPVIVEVHNNSGSAISKGAAVYVSGTHTSGKPTIALADSDGAGTYPAIGLVHSDVPDATEGYVLISGTLANLDTSSYIAGEALYLSTTAGELVNVRPSDASTKVQKVGLVTRSHASSGSILVIGAGRTNDVPNTFQMTGTIETTERTITAGSFDLATGNHWTCGAITVPAPTNATAGTSGLIRITAGPVVWNGVFKFPGGAAPTIAAFPAIIPFYVQSSSEILMGNVAEGIA